MDGMEAAAIGSTIVLQFAHGYFLNKSPERCLFPGLNSGALLIGQRSSGLAHDLLEQT
jgi:hypothetical protein